MNCEKALTIVVNDSSFQYWPMEEASGNRVDVNQGANIVPALLGGSTCNQVAGKVDFAMELNCTLAGSAVAEEVQAEGLPYVVGQGMTLCGWFNAGGLAPAGSVGIGFGLLPNTFTVAFAVGSGSCFIQGPFGNTPSTAPTLGVWHFFLLELQPGGIIQWEQDNVVVTTTIPQLEYPDGEVVPCAFQLSTANTAWAFDEVLFAPFVLTQAQKDYLFNGGAGRTTPINLP